MVDNRERQEAKRPGKPGLFSNWCGRGDSNPHALASASPSSWCVCQFRHFRKERGLRKFYFGPVAPVAPVAGAGAVDDGAGVVAGAGVSGAFAGAPGTLGGGAEPLTIDPGPRCPMIASASAPSMNRTASTVVALDSTVAPARAPNADWLLPPPNAAAMSPLPCCSRMTSSSSRQTITYRVESR